MRSLALLLLLAAGCSDDGLKVYNNPPSVTITSPVHGSEHDENEALFLEGEVHDDGPYAELSVDWLDSVSGVIAEDVEVQADGGVQVITSNLQPGPHTLILRAIDPEAENDEDTVEITILPVPERPSITVLHPDVLGEERGLEDNPFVFMVQVGDRQDAAEDLTVELVASPYGLVCTMYPDGAGVAQCPHTLPLGAYDLSFTVWDTDGNEAIAHASFQVVTRGDYDMDGDGYTPNGGDCNDSNDTIYPGAPEICDGLDNDCIDSTPIDAGTDCYDDDGDGYCEVPPCVNTSQGLSDCDDNDPYRYPDESVIELVNGKDDDCDGIIDDETVVYDDDGDGYCEVPPCLNTIKRSSDCDDANPNASPGKTEICGDGFDNDCDGQVNQLNAIGCTDFYLDEDSDTWGVSGPTECWCDDGSYPYTGLNTRDCYDYNANAYPGQTSYYAADRGDGSFDYDCNGSNEKQYLGSFTGCDWSFEPFSCEVLGDGWKGGNPACGSSGTWVGDCDGSYDVICMALCAYSDPTKCTSCWDCEADESSLTQSCR